MTALYRVVNERKIRDRYRAREREGEGDPLFNYSFFFFGLMISREPLISSSMGGPVGETIVNENPILLQWVERIAINPGKDKHCGRPGETRI